MAVAAVLLSGTNAVQVTREPLLTWAPTPKASAYPKDFFVPHFGEDSVITSTKKNIRDAEAKYGHILDTSPPPDAPPRDYFVPHFGYDEDIVASVKNLNDQEKKFGTWNLPMNVQLDAQVEREPLLTWAPTPKKSHPMNYFVPNFGEDSDIKASKGHEAGASATLKHVWTPTKDKDGEWEVPTTTAFFNLAQKEKK